MFEDFFIFIFTFYIFFIFLNFFDTKYICTFLCFDISNYIEIILLMNLIRVYLKSQSSFTKWGNVVINQRNVFDSTQLKISQVSELNLDWVGWKLKYPTGDECFVYSFGYTSNAQSFWHRGPNSDKALFAFRMGSVYLWYTLV